MYRFRKSRIALGRTYNIQKSDISVYLQHRQKYGPGKSAWLRAKAHELNTTKIPKSELWFKELYKDFIHKKDEFNGTLSSKYIPDVINRHFMYIIEIDGTIHKKEFKKNKDRIRTEFFIEQGFTVFRIEAFNIECFKKVITDIVRFRGKKSYIM